MNNLAAAGELIIRTIFGIYIFFVLARFFLQLFRADFYNPLSQGVVTVTNPVLRPLRRIIPGLGGIDVASLVLVVALMMLQLFLVFLLYGRTAALLGLFLLALVEIVRLIIWIFLIAIFLQIIISLVSPGAYNHFTQVLYSFTRPLLEPARRLLPAFGGLDLSPIIPIVGLQLVLMLLVSPLATVAQRFL